MNLMYAPMKRSATLSDCGTFRWELERIWEQRLPRIIYIMLNPSDGDAERDDNTIKQCIQFAAMNGFGGFVIVNLFAQRSPKPAVLFVSPDAIGPENDNYIRKHIRRMGNQDKIVLAWGTMGGFLKRDEAVMDIIRKEKKQAFVLALTKERKPVHPLYLSQQVVGPRGTPIARPLMRFI